MAVNSIKYSLSADKEINLSNEEFTQHKKKRKRLYRLYHKAVRDKDNKLLCEVTTRMYDMCSQKTCKCTRGSKKCLGCLFGLFNKHHDLMKRGYIISNDARVAELISTKYAIDKMNRRVN